MKEHYTTERLHTEIVQGPLYRLPENSWILGRNVILFLALAGWILAAVGFTTNRAQFHVSYLVSFTCCVSILLAGMFFVMVQHLTGSAWSVTVRRLMESIISTMPVAALLFLPVAFGLHSLYEWTHLDVVAADPILSGKARYLNERWFLIRAALFFALWTLWAWKLHGHSTKQDTSLTPIEHMHGASRWSAPGLLLVIVTGTLASFDWIMSLDPHWYSTIFGLYVISGGAQAFFALLILICLAFRKAGILRREITTEHYHDLGKWLFALTVFWAYIGFSQYMLIWYANIPEETIFYRHRLEGSWSAWSLLLLLGRFIIPFLILMPRAAKRTAAVIGPMSGWILFNHFVDHYWMIAPNFQHHGVALHWMDFAAIVAVASTLALAFWWPLKKHSLVPVRDPRLDQALGFHNA
jgi:hypothetical protein